MDKRPKLRHLEAIRHSMQGRDVAVLRDPQGISPVSLVVLPELLPVLSLLNGQNTLFDIQAELTRMTGQISFRETIESMVRQLDQAHFLDNGSFQRFHSSLLEKYSAETLRPGYHAGLSYPENPQDVTEMLNGFYLDPEGAGLPGPCGEKAQQAMIVPHIDLRLGGPVYTHSYRLLAEGPQPDLFVILGTGHQGLQDHFSVSEKDFETPMGRLGCARDFASHFRRTAGKSSFPDQLPHRTEHTIEFQLIFLQHLLPADSFEIFPVLCSLHFSELAENCSAARDVLRCAEALRESTEKVSRRICFVVSVDLAHVGPRYGDNFVPDSESIEMILNSDLQMLETVAEGDAEAFCEFVSREKDWRKICGFPAIYLLLKAFPDLRGRLLKHSHCRIDESGSVVTYAAMSFPG